jgi:hypothetical protein
VVLELYSNSSINHIGHRALETWLVYMGFKDLALMSLYSNYMLKQEYWVKENISLKLIQQILSFLIWLLEIYIDGCYVFLLDSSSLEFITSV